MWNLLLFSTLFLKGSFWQLIEGHEICYENQQDLYYFTTIDC